MFPFPVQEAWRWTTSSLAPPSAPSHAIPGVYLVQAATGAQNGGSHILGFRWRRGGAHTPPLREMSMESYWTLNLGISVARTCAPVAPRRVLLLPEPLFLGSCTEGPVL